MYIIVTAVPAGWQEWRPHLEEKPGTGSFPALSKVTLETLGAAKGLSDSQLES